MNAQTRGIISWIIVGLVAGWLASLIVGEPASLVGYLIAGLVGSVVGGFLAQMFKIKLNFGNPYFEQLIISVVGAIIVVLVARLIIT